MISLILRNYIWIIILPLIIIRFLIIQSSSLTFFSDDAIYASFARNWHEGDLKYVFHPFWPPLYPFLSSLTFNLVNSWEIALRLASLLSSILLIIPVYYLVKYQTSKLTATLASISLFLLTPIVHFSIFPLSDMLSTFLIISSLTAMYFALIHENTKLFIMTAILLGLTYLTRSEGTMFFGLSTMYLAIYLIYRLIFKKTSPKKLILLPAFLIVFFTVTSPYLIATKYQLGSWSLSQKFNAQIQQGHAFEYKNNTTWAYEIWSVKSPNYSSPYFKNGTKFVINNFYGLVDSFFEKQQAWQRFLFENFPIWFVVVTMLGLFFVRQKTLWADFFIIYVLVFAIPITIFSTSVIDIRYFLWIIPLIVIFFYKALFILLSKFPHVIRSCVPFTMIALLPVFSSESLDVNAYSKKFTDIHNRPQLKMVAEFIKQNSQSKEPKVMTRHEGIEFYSRAVTIYLPQASYNQILEYAQKHKVDYIVAWNRELKQEEELLTLVEMDNQHEKLKKEVTLNTPEGPIIVYSLESDHFSIK